jgi:hypothetical protein
MSDGVRREIELGGQWPVCWRPGRAWDQQGQPEKPGKALERAGPWGSTAGKARCHLRKALARDARRYEIILTLEVRVVRGLGVSVVTSVHVRVELVRRCLLGLLSRLRLSSGSLSGGWLGSGLLGGFLGALSAVTTGVRVVEGLKRGKRRNHEDAPSNSPFARKSTCRCRETATAEPGAGRSCTGSAGSHRTTTAEAGAVAPAHPPQTLTAGPGAPTAAGRSTLDESAAGSADVERSGWIDRVRSSRR